MFSLAGREGTLRAGGRVAARLGAWTIEAGVRGWRFEATVLGRDDYLLGVTPQELRLVVGGSVRRIGGVAATLDDDGRLVARGEGEPL